MGWDFEDIYNVSYNLTFAANCRVLIVDEGDVVPGKHLHQAAEEHCELVVVAAETCQGTVGGVLISECFFHTAF